MIRNIRKLYGIMYKQFYYQLSVTQDMGSSIQRLRNRNTTSICRTINSYFDRHYFRHQDIQDLPGYMFGRCELGLIEGADDIDMALVPHSKEEDVSGDMDEDIEDTSC